MSEHTLSNVKTESRVLRAYRSTLRTHAEDTVPEFRGTFIQKFADLLGAETDAEVVSIKNYDLMLQTARDEHTQAHPDAKLIV